MISVNVLTLTLLVGTVVPILVGIVTKSTAASGLKAFANVILSAVAGGGTALLASNGGLPWQQVFIAAFATYVASGSAHAHLWSPLGVTGSGSVVENATGNLGVG